MSNIKQEEVIKDLRTEAHQVKECAVQYFVRSMIFVTGFLAAIVAIAPHSKYAPLASVLALPMLYANLKILLHKYGTANRNLGYQLHLEQSQHYRELYTSTYSWKQYYGNIGWEEAMRAWRIVQATVFEAICDKKYNKYKPTVKNICYPWFDVKKLIERNKEKNIASYYASSFLKNMLFVVHILMYVSLLPLIYILYNSKNNITFLLVVSLLLFLALLYIKRAVIFTNGRRYQLESGILSISSCAIVWHAVILAHFRALDIRKGLVSEERTRENGYAYNVSLQAIRLAENISDIHKWIEGEWLRKEGREICKKSDDIHKSISSKGLSEEKIELLDKTDRGIGAYIKCGSKLNKGDEVNYEGKKGEIVYMTQAYDNDKCKVGIKFL